MTTGFEDLLASLAIDPDAADGLAADLEGVASAHRLSHREVEVLRALAASPGAHAPSRIGRRLAHTAGAAEPGANGETTVTGRGRQAGRQARVDDGDGHRPGRMRKGTADHGAETTPAPDAVGPAGPWPREGDRA